MPSRERRLLDKDKEIRKLKNNLGHYFTNSIVLGIKNEILKQQLKIATDALKWIAYDENDEQDGLEEFAISQMVEKASKALEQINELKEKKMKCILIIFALTLAGCSMERLDGYTDYSIFTGEINE